ncbi:MAG: hypothetical protein E4H27_09160 [Anaerolineales bacterium]|nr:MAG: hypothetical protein E4H27_09160 [Anaerolineales bacterium]
MNRVRIVDLPGIEVDKEVVGEQAYHLLSAPALVRYALAQADALILPAQYRTGDPDRFELRRDCPLFVDACLQNPNNTVRKAADDIARRLGRNLGFILLTLHRGDPENRQVRPDWTAREWARWHRIREVHIGGGIVSGILGDRLIHTARELIASAGYANYLNVTKSPLPRSMAVLGASRYLPPYTHNALCLDIGQTSIKAAIAQYEEGVLTGLTWLPTSNVAWRWRNAPEAADSIDPDEVLRFVTQEILKLLEAANRQGIVLDPDIMISIAAYVHGGELLGNGIYARMRLLDEDTRVLLAHAIQDKANHNTVVHLIHDGTAAAAVHAGEKDAVVLVLGTAIGVGFVPESALMLRPISPDVRYQQSVA